MDHFLSREKARKLAYEWSNFRYASGSVNSSKHTLDDTVLDPYEVRMGWFEIILPSFQLILTDKVPPVVRDKAVFTIERLNLENGPKVRTIRRRYYEDFKNGKLTMAGLHDYAPLVAKAVERHQQNGIPLP